MDNNQFEGFDEQAPSTPSPEEIKRNAKKMQSIFSKTGFALTIILIVTYLTQILLLAIFKEKLVGNISLIMVISTLTLDVFGIGSAVLFLKAVKCRGEEPTEKKKMTVGSFLVTFMICYSAMQIGNIIGTVFTSFLSAILGHTVQNPISSTIQAMPVWLTFILVVIIAPIMEELLFRKMLIDRFRKYGDKIAIVMSALFFGLFHQNFSQFFYAAMLGLILGYVYCRTGNVKYTIGLHMIINFLGSIVPMTLLKFVDLKKIQEYLTAQNYEALADNAIPIIVYLAYIALIYAVVIDGFVLFIIKVRKCTFKKSEIPLPPNAEYIRRCFLNPGVIIAFILCAMLMVVSLLPNG